ncbi:polysaccharide biosynthesis tyrosine autokinase [Bifidobacterium ramosum]|uniref:polysaccharide biosynthesis tyrosine autokinase n=1 Tax=Bifidobacterium ramosum TaxID=1798158 RepID=UPI001F1130C7|nr:polysaccharide biosynthesis tyrosine autokinase [Bifidobacterium ramosum]
MITIDVVGAVKKHVVTAIITAIVVIAGVCGYTFTRTPQYTATAQLMATYRGTTQDTNANSYNAGSSYIQSQIQTYPQLVKTESVLQPVIDNLGLNTTVSDLAKQVTASNPTDTMLVEVSVEDTDPKTSSNIANSVAESLRKQVTSTLYSDDGDKIVSPVNLSVVQQAYVPASPSSPNVAMNLAIGVVGGIVLGVVAAVVRDLLDRRVRQSSDVQAIVDAQVLGTFTRSDVFADVPVIISRPASREAEDVRRLRTNLTFSDTGDDRMPNVIVVTSSSPSEGKTTVATNLATAFAESGSKVLLIDTDVRNPSVAKKLKIEGTVGLTHLVTGQVTSQEAVQRYWKPNFHVLPAGRQTMNPSILLNSRAMKSLIRKVAETYDYVIIDTAPMQVSNDAAVFAKEGPELLLVTGLGVAEKRRLRETDEELETLGIEPVGVVLSFAEQEKQKDNYYYYYGVDGEKKSKHKKDGAAK